MVCRLGRVYLEQGQLDIAAVYLRDADAWTLSHEQSGSLRWYLCYDLARLALAQGNLEEAEKEARERLKRCELLKLREADQVRELLKVIRNPPKPAIDQA